MQGGRTSRSWLPAPPTTVAVQTGKEKKYRVATFSLNFYQQHVTSNIKLPKNSID